MEDLCARGLLRRASSTEDRRINRLTLTDEGLTKTQLVRRLIHTDEDRLLRRLTGTERGQLRNLLTRALDPETL